MIVLDMGPYDAILGYDWLRENSPMQFDWSKKTIQFSVDGKKGQASRSPSTTLGSYPNFS
jgi:hypothetical protein